MSSDDSDSQLTRDHRPGILVIIGALGDLCVRRVLEDARAFVAREDNDIREIILIDRQSSQDIDSWIARRLLEQKFEQLDCERVLKHKKASWLAENDPHVPDPTSDGVTVDEAFKDFAARFASGDIRELCEDFTDLSGWIKDDLTIRPFGRPLRRYWQSITQDSLTFLAEGWEDAATGDSEITGNEVRTLSRDYRIIVYVATPPQVYLDIIKQWGEYADRIALEKPICGLLEKKDDALRLAGTESTVHTDVHEIIQRTAFKRADRNLPPLEVVTIDHYNSKWITRAIDDVKARHIVEHILIRPTRILVEVLETELLPTGRLYFYNSVGGAFADMAAHLMQPLRAIAGYASAAAMLKSLHVVHVTRAQYEFAPTLCAPRPRRYKGKYNNDDAVSKLLADTETFAEVQLKFISGEWTGVEVILRTGKGIHPPSKLLRVYGHDEGEGVLTATFDIARNKISTGIGENIKDFEWSSGKGTDTSQDAERGREDPASEYEDLFADLCKWDMPDPRYFPPVREAAKVCEFVRKILVKERHRGPIKLPAYSPYCDYAIVDPSTPGTQTDLDANTTESVARRSAADLKEGVPGRTGQRHEDTALATATLTLERAKKSLAASNADIDQINRQIEKLVSETQ